MQDVTTIHSFPYLSIIYREDVTFQKRFRTMLTVRSRPTGRALMIFRLWGHLWWHLPRFFKIWSVPSILLFNCSCHPFVETTNWNALNEPRGLCSSQQTCPTFLTCFGVWLLCSAAAPAEEWVDYNHGDCQHEATKASRRDIARLQIRHRHCLRALTLHRFKAKKKW